MEITKYEKKLKVTDQKMVVWKLFSVSSSCRGKMVCLMKGIKCFDFFFGFIFLYFSSFWLIFYNLTTRKNLLLAMYSAKPFKSNYLGKIIE